MPLLVISSRGVGVMTTRSPSGRSVFDVEARSVAVPDPFLDPEDLTGLVAAEVAIGVLSSECCFV